MNSIPVIETRRFLALRVDSDVLANPQGAASQCETGTEQGHDDPVLPDLAWLIATYNGFSGTCPQRSA